MKSSLYNLEKLLSFRRDLHKHAEGSFNEFRTSAKIIEYLLELGIKEDQIRKVASTGLVVDIKGTAPPSGKPYCIAIRADMDALPIKEQNPEIDYASITDYAHMCGHDTHVTCLLGGAAKVLEKLDQIPSDKCLRLLFQPAEEDEGGAFPMLQEGVMEGVDEVYGMHNWPFDLPGKVYVKPGYMMACITHIDIKIHGKGGKASQLEGVIDPIQPAIDIQKGLKEIVQEFKDKGYYFTVSLPLIRGSDDPEFVADTCNLGGYLRAFDVECIVGIKKRIQDLVESSCRNYNCKVDCFMQTTYPAVNNTEKETENFIKIAKKVVGEENVVDTHLPVLGAEDFSFFQKAAPGVFFFCSSSRKPTDVLHTNCFNPHDDYIPIACEIHYRVVENRFGLEFK